MAHTCKHYLDAEHAQKSCNGPTMESPGHVHGETLEKDEIQGLMCCSTHLLNRPPHQISAWSAGVSKNQVTTTLLVLNTLHTTARHLHRRWKLLYTTNRDANTYTMLSPDRLLQTGGGGGGDLQHCAHWQNVSEERVTVVRKKVYLKLVL